MDDVVFVRLTQYKVAMIDAIDATKILPHKWHVHKSSYKYYACRKVGSRGKQKRIFMHHVISQPDEGQETHHIDGNSLNNRNNNLLNCTRKENLQYQQRGKSYADSSVGR